MKISGGANAPLLVAHLERGDGLSKLTNYTRGVGYNLLLFPAALLLFI